MRVIYGRDWTWLDAAPARGRGALLLVRVPSTGLDHRQKAFVHVLGKVYRAGLYGPVQNDRPLEGADERPGTLAGPEVEHELLFQIRLEFPVKMGREALYELSAVVYVGHRSYPLLDLVRALRRPAGPAGGRASHNL